MSDPASKQAIAAFYDDFSGRLVRGYVNGNPRVNDAVQFAIDSIPEYAESVLEVGCGVGETTHRLLAAHPHLRGCGVDISPENIASAKRLFGNQNGPTFSVSDL